MDIQSKAFFDLIKSFNENQVQYLLVGGLAVNHYGYNRSTGDVDFWLKDNAENRERLINSFLDLEYGYFQELLTFPFLPGYCEIYLDSGIYADLLSEIHGFSQQEFDICYEQAKEVKIQNVTLRFISLKDLIYSKSQSHRPKDIEDVKELKKTYDL